jgi:hypothetical protein
VTSHNPLSMTYYLSRRYALCSLLYAANEVSCN